MIDFVNWLRSDTGAALASRAAITGAKPSQKAGVELRLCHPSQGTWGL